MILSAASLLRHEGSDRRLGGTVRCRGLRSGAAAETDGGGGLMARKKLSALAAPF